MYTLYSYPVSQHSRRVAALLAEAGIDYEARIVDMEKGEYLSPEYLAVNPNHQVPTLIDGDLKIHESNAILRYICNVHGLVSWYPTDARARALVDQWLDWNQCQLGPAVVNIVLNKVFMPELGNTKAIELGEEQIKELFPILAARLSQSDYLAGDQVTIADLSVAANVTHLWFADVMSEDQAIGDWIERMMAVSGFRKTLPAPLR